MTLNIQTFSTGHVEVPEDRRDADPSALPAHIAWTRVEPGRLRFKLTEDTGYRGRYVVSEPLVSRTDFEIHQARAAASSWAQIIARIPQQSTIKEVSS